MRCQCPGPGQRPEEHHTTEQCQLTFSGQLRAQLGTGYVGVGGVLCTLVEPRGERWCRYADKEAKQQCES